ncbi:uncharacterized protein EV154DRAFT_553743 [Mucor mucedo]|uniref:uncharacterized protein n=1 Tax=Mucor mucedo TaxID=29922 RepID=UPI00221F18AE|nr:uncharacterized protein EV154DRAFT_553743 [Mucor mucedo]KAI7888511.1 hypothetical protein EV154DRAFT_553743 [Mucor mucedo]
MTMAVSTMTMTVSAMTMTVSAMTVTVSTMSTMTCFGDFIKTLSTANNFVNNRNGRSPNLQDSEQKKSDGHFHAADFRRRCKNQLLSFIFRNGSFWNHAILFINHLRVTKLTNFFSNEYLTVYQCLIIRSGFFNMVLFLSAMSPSCKSSLLVHNPESLIKQLRGALLLRSIYHVPGMTELINGSEMTKIKQRSWMISVLDHPHYIQQILCSRTHSKRYCKKTEHMLGIFNVRVGLVTIPFPLSYLEEQEKALMQSFSSNVDIESSRFCLLLVSTFVLLFVTVTEVDGLPLDCNFEKGINSVKDHERALECQMEQEAKLYRSF